MDWIPPEIARPPGTPWVIVGNSNTWCRRGTKSRVAELANVSSCEHNNTNPHFLTNARSLTNNTGKLPS